MLACVQAKEPRIGMVAIRQHWADVEPDTLQILYDSVNDVKNHIRLAWYKINEPDHIIVPDWYRTAAMADGSVEASKTGHTAGARQARTDTVKASRKVGSLGKQHNSSSPRSNTTKHGRIAGMENASWLDDASYGFEHDLEGRRQSKRIKRCPKAGRYGR